MALAFTKELAGRLSNVLYSTPDIGRVLYHTMSSLARNKDTAASAESRAVLERKIRAEQKGGSELQYSIETVRLSLPCGVFQHLPGHVSLVSAPKDYRTPPRPS
jgi:hypothetical protein